VATLDSATLPQRGTAPQFSADVCCAQMARWIQLPLGTEVSLGPGDIVLGGGLTDPDPPKKGHSPNFWHVSTVAKRLDGSK